MPTDAPGRCLHCGQGPIDPTAHSPSAPDAAFCCHGCATVHDTIAKAGLGHYYRFRSVTATRVEAPDKAAHEIYNQPDVQQTFLLPAPAGTARARLLIHNAHCPACGWLIESHLALQPKVRSATYQSSDQTVEVEWMTEQPDIAALMASLTAIGYKAEPAAPNLLAKARRKQHRSWLTRLAVSGVFTMQVMMIAMADYFDIGADMTAPMRQFLGLISALLAAPVVIFGAAPFWQGARQALKQRTPNMDVPIALAVLLAYAASLHASLNASGGPTYFDSVCMLVFFLLLGRYFHFAVHQRFASRFERLHSGLPALAHRRTETGVVKTPVTALQAGDRIVVAEGSTVPVDATLSGELAEFSLTALSGESQPVRLTRGDTVLAGSINLSGNIELCVEHSVDASYLSTIERLIAEGQQHRPAALVRLQAKLPYFSLGLLLLALFTLISLLLLGNDEALERTIALLVITCPCAVALAIPAAHSLATQAAVELGIIPRNGDWVDRLSAADLAVFDKTGTLTENWLPITRVTAEPGVAEAELWRIASLLTAGSPHPIARAIQRDCPAETVTSHRSVPGRGIEACIDDTCYRIGSAAFVGEWLPQPPQPRQDEFSTRVFVASANQRLGTIEFSPRLRDGAAEAIEQLQSLGLDIALLSGDSGASTQALAQAAGIACWRGDQLPEHKQAWLRDQQRAGRVCLMVGDGINDAPALAAADLSIAMPSASDLSLASADAVMTTEALHHLPDLILLTRRTQRIIRENLFWVLAYNAIAIPVALTGWVTPWLAAIGMSASSLVVLANARRVKIDARRHTNTAPCSQPTSHHVATS